MGEGTLLQRDLSLSLSGSWEVCSWAEDVQVQFICVRTVSATDASLTALFGAC